MNSNEYILHEIGVAEKDHNQQYCISVKFSDTKNSSRNVNLTSEQMQQIKAIFEGAKQ